MVVISVSTEFGSQCFQTALFILLVTDYRTELGGKLLDGIDVRFCTQDIVLEFGLYG